MMGEQQNEVRVVFAEALALTVPDERARYLEAACRDKPELRQRVEALLQAAGTVGDFLNQDALGGPLDCDAPPVSEGPGTIIGHYRLLEQIGEGGFGVVFMTEQVEPIRRRVALKIVKPGMDTKQVIARFEAERQALALMDHPNIAKVFDAGATESGRPYFVMELVRGVPLTRFCDANTLTPTERLKLFMTICEAVQHAHQKGIIHRDLKPSNILVTLHDGKPVPKVIDFGTAKALQQPLTEKTLFTAYGKLIGTPLYMSPEQAEMSGLDVDTRADIYSLGVLLYELLTGTTPFEAERLRTAAFEEMMHIIREEEPPKPSTRVSTLGERATEIAKHRQVDPVLLRRTLRGDLDWIVMKALEKDRTRRYETAHSLALDLQRHLDNEPVVARPPSRVYRFERLVRRNKAIFAAGGAIALALVAGLAVSTWSLFMEKKAHQRAVSAERAAETAHANEAKLRRQAEQDEHKARLEASKSAQVARFLKDMLQGVGPSVALGRDTTMLKDILEKTAERLGKDLTSQPEVEAELRNIIGFAYWELGEHDKAQSMYRESLKLMRQAWGNDHAAVADTLHNLAELLRRTGQADEAEATERQALAIYEKLFGHEHGSVGASLTTLGSVLNARGRLEEAEAILRQALAINQKVLPKDDPQLGLTLSRLGMVLEEKGKLTDAEATYRNAVSIQSKALAEQPAGLAPHVELAWTLTYLSSVLARQERWAEAERAQREALAVVRNVLSAEHRDVLELRDKLAYTLAAQGKLADAETIFRESLELRRKTLGGERPEVAHTLNDLGQTLARQGKLAEAEPFYRDALALRIKLLENIAPSLTGLHSVLRAQGRLDEIKAVSKATREASQAVLRREQSAKVFSFLTSVITAFIRARDFASAEALAREALAAQKDVVGDAPANLARSFFELGFALQMEGKLVEAERALRESAAIYRKLGLLEDPQAGEMFERLAQVLKTLGKQDPEIERFARTHLVRKASQSKPWVTFKLRIQTPGQYRLYVRWDGHDSHSASLFAHIIELDDDGPAVGVYDFAAKTPDADFATLPWEGSALAEGYSSSDIPTLWTISKPGDYTLEFNQVEDGAAVDAFVLQLSSLPPPQGEGPPESELTPDKVFLERGGRIVSEAEHFTARVADNGGNRWLIVPQESPGDVPHLHYRGTGYIQSLPDTTPEDPAQLLVNRASAQAQARHFPEAEAAFRQAIDLFKRSAEGAPGNSHDPKQLGHTLWQLGNLLIDAGRHEAAEEVLREALQVFEKACRSLPGDRFLRQEQAFSRRLLAGALGEQGRLDEAEHHYHAAIELYGALKAEAPTNAFYHQEEAYTTWTLATMLAHAHRLDAAAAEYRRAIALHKKACANFPDNAEFKSRLARILEEEGEFLRDRGRLDEAAKTYRNVPAL